MISKNRIKLIHSLEQRKQRKLHGLFVAEGHKLVGDLLSTFQPVYIAACSSWITTHAPLWAQLQARGCECNEVSEDELHKASLMKSPQQGLALFKMMKPEAPQAAWVKQELCLALDGIQDPGNMGTIVRIADWFGINHIICSLDTADVYNPKTIQATMGALARVKVSYTDLPAWIARLPQDSSVYGTFLDGDNMYNNELTAHGLIIMGNEGKGISHETAKHVNRRLFIPNYPASRATSESLNVGVATAIICAEFRRRME